MLVPHNFDWPDTCVSKLNESFTTPTYTYTCNRNVEHFAVGWKKFWNGSIDCAEYNKFPRVSELTDLYKPSRNVY